MSKRAAPRLYVDNTQRWILIWAVSGLIAIGAGAVPAFADGPVPLGPAPKEPPGIPFVIEEAILGPVGEYRPGRLWIVDQRGDCGVAWDCGAWTDDPPDEPAPVPLPAGVWLLIAAIAALILKGRKL